MSSRCDQSLTAKIDCRSGRRVIFHADDLGMNPAVSDGILEGFRRGVLTSTSVLANAPDAARALALWKQLLTDHAAGRLSSQPCRRELADPPEPFDLGMHLNLTQGAPLTRAYPAELLDEDGRFPGVFSLLSRLRWHPEKHAAAIRRELGRQIEFLREHGLQPTHLNGHQYIELLPAVTALLPDLFKRYQIGVVRVAEEPRLWRSTLGNRFSPGRWISACVKKGFARRFRRRIARQPVAYPEVFYGTAHAGRITLPLLRLFLDAQKTPQTVEICLHPARVREALAPERKNGWHDPLETWRPHELQLLISPELAEYLQQGRFRLTRLQLLRES
jgi:predicted glycoside hydrolase/deacetylase ChbG (UPF0249 family)